MTRKEFESRMDDARCSEIPLAQARFLEIACELLFELTKQVDGVERSVDAVRGKM